MPEAAAGALPVVRFGLVGTGYWARITHAPVLAATAGVELVAVWGRDPQAASRLASEHGAAACADLDELIASVDALAFSVPPDVQASMALRAARSGKHLLLEKPIATSLDAADALVRAVEDSGVASVVFFTARFQADVRAWLAEVTSRGGWMGGSGIWLGTSLTEGSPFNTPWRRLKGALWDLGPHAVSLLWAALGPVVAVAGEPGRGDVAHLVLHHEGGASSTVTVTQGASEAAAGSDFSIWGEFGRSEAPKHGAPATAALAVAASELVANARAGAVAHACDVHFGREVVRVLATAERQMAANTRSRAIIR
ncbi:MAG TPA: Gfo/Idh/MocA family oxidoreductase [Acidimicrobiales bacterium]|nr:Gfo/Idh/MocA family oxidoreductase [Acidimicrobiales bacterium]